MANSTFTHKEKGFWVADAFLEVAYFYMQNEIAKKLKESLKKEDIKWLEDLYEKLSFYLMGIMPGAIGLDLDRLLENECHKKLFISILNKTKKYLKGRGNLISIDEPNTIERLKIDNLVLWGKAFRGFCYN